MLRKLLSVALAMLLFPAVIMAQSGSVTGTVIDQSTGETLPGTNVVLQELQRGSATDTDGNYTIDNVPNGSYTLVATFVGYKKYQTTVQVSGATTVDISLKPDYFGLEEVVVTGVGQGTQTTKLGFSVGKIDEKQLQEVPATDPGNALRGKVAGVTVVQASGDPSAGPDIRLRGSTAISTAADQDPLIIVDGVITDGNLRDINMEDVKSIEVVKGAAAASMYGSLAGNGVIQIITKRNADKAGEPQFTIRSEYGFSDLTKEYPLATKHPYPTDNIQTDGSGHITQWPGFDTYDADSLFDNDYPVIYDNQDKVFKDKPFNTNYFSLANSGEKYNYKASFENMTQGGVLEPIDNYNRNTFRLNADYTPNDKFAAKFSSSYITVKSPRISEQGQGDNYFYSVLTAQPFMDLTQKNTDGTYSNKPTGYAIQSSNWQNPLYTAQNRERNFDRDRVIAGVTLEYNLTDYFSVHARQSLDKSYQLWKTYYPVGYQTPTPSANNNGSDYRRSIKNSTAVTELWGQFNREFGDFNVKATAKYLYENRDYEWFEAQGSDYIVKGIRDL
ncbi:MAG: carboxypeptidase-like regulatory domain-containing protein, partial [Balneolaceae bacterium]